MSRFLAVNDRPILAAHPPCLWARFRANGSHTTRWSGPGMRWNLNSCNFVPGRSARSRYPASVTLAASHQASGCRHFLEYAKANTSHGSKIHTPSFACRIGDHRITAYLRVGHCHQLCSPIICLQTPGNRPRTVRHFCPCTSVRWIATLLLAVRSLWLRVCPACSSCIQPACICLKTRGSGVCQQVG